MRNFLLVGRRLGQCEGGGWCEEVVRRRKEKRSVCLWLMTVPVYFSFHVKNKIFAA